MSEPQEYSAQLLERFQDLHDEELIVYARKGDMEALECLLERYKLFVRSKARRYFLIGADHEDLVQEGMIGLYKAVRDYSADKNVSFSAFADMCVRRQMLTAIKNASRKKHIPLNSYVSLNRPVYDDDSDRTLLEVIDGQHLNPEEMFVSQEKMKDLKSQIDTQLSPFEKTALEMFLSGKSYVEIAMELGRHVKAVDNALQRVKKKLNHFLHQ